MDTPIYEIHSESEQGNRIFIKRDDLLPFSLGGNKVRIGWEFYRDEAVFLQEKDLILLSE